MIRLVKFLFRLLVFVCIVAVVCFGTLDLWFTHFNHIDRKVKAAAAQRYKVKSIHPLEYEQIPLVFREAIIATEDRRFTSDPGIDPVGIMRSLVVDIEHDGYVEGGSTITQQVIDNTLLSRNKTMKQKALQAIYAIGLYDTMPKEEVLSLYTNVIYFGHGAYGLYQAAETYFHRPPADLNQGELTLLAGLPNSPTNYDPFYAMNLARSRQRVILQNMVDAGVLTVMDVHRIYQEPIRLAK